MCVCVCTRTYCMFSVLILGVHTRVYSDNGATMTFNMRH